MRVRYSFSSRKTGNIENISRQRIPFPKQVQDMIAICDIILEVLDARFIDETRNIALENFIKASNKRIIYVLNKSDLINIKEKKQEIEQKDLYPHVFLSSKERKGGRELRNRIKMEVKNLKTNFSRAQVGVIGYPNTGKSTLINFLIGKSSARTAPEAGFTRGLQKVKLTANILIIDTPGVIPDKDYSSTANAAAKHAKIGVRTYDKVKDPDFIVASLMEKYSKEIQDFYKIDAQGNSETLIEQLGRQKNLLKKGNEVNTDRTARFILKDWQDGKIRV